MFWRNKTAALSIEFHDQNRRRAYRIEPESGEISLSINGQLAVVTSLSSVGIAFNLERQDELLMPMEAELILPNTSKPPIPLWLKTVDQHQHLYRCEIKTDPYSLNRLCHFLVRYQIHQIRKMQGKQNFSEKP